MSLHSPFFVSVCLEINVLDAGVHRSFVCAPILEFKLNLDIFNAWIFDYFSRANSNKRMAA